MSRLPHISDVISQVREEVTSLRKVAAPTETAPVHSSRLSLELMKCADLLRRRGNQAVTYEDVFALSSKFKGKD